MSTELEIKADGIQVLVVDDNEVNTMVVASMLEQLEVQVTECYSGKDAIEKAKYSDYDIIFMDYVMPEMDGIEATEEIRKLGKVKRPIIVALSANETQDLKEKFQKAGVDDVVSKPLELDKVCEIFKKWIPERMLSTEAIEQSADEKATSIKEMFSHVKELDVEKGLSHLANSAENYIKVIEAAVENIRSECKLLSVYRVSQVQPSSMKNAFHSLKGVFLNLGAKHLSERSQLFELACTDGSVELLTENLVSYLEELEKFVEDLEAGLQRYDANYASDMSQKYVPMSEEEFKRYYASLVFYLERYEYNNLHELVTRLLYASQGEQREKFINAGRCVQNFQYEEALAIVKTMEPEEELIEG